jgi:hypothetical protein
MHDPSGAILNIKGGLPMCPSMVRLVVVAFVCALATPAGAELLGRKDLSLATALTIATTAAETCKAQGHRVSVTRRSKR